MSALELDILRMLRRSAQPLSGRQVAAVAGVAPNTANRVLKLLQQQGLVSSVREGRASRWTTTADVSQLKELEGSPQDRVVLVVTAVELEYTEVRNRLVNVKPVREGEIWMLRGEVPGDHINWTVYLAQAGMGNATSAALVGLAARELKANLVAFVGIAGGLKPDDHKHLDVVVASRIHNPYTGKQVAGRSGSELLGRDNTYHQPASLLTVVKACISESGWTSATRSPHYDADHAHAFVAPIVSVEAVQTDENGPVLKEVRRRYQDAAAVDMESFGLAAGSDIHDLPVLVVRGLSDFVGDKSKVGNDNLQPLAAGNAAGLFRDVLVFAHPDDFKRGVAPTAPPVTPPEGQQSAPGLTFPGGIQMWMDRLTRRSPKRAADATKDLMEMRNSGVTAATWLNRALHRPPTWLREDDSGDGWALVATLATLAGSKVGWRAFEEAARAAMLTGDLDASAYFLLTSTLVRVEAAENGPARNDDGAAAAALLDAVGDEVDARFGTVVQFFQAVLEKDLSKCKTRAELALATLGLRDSSGVLREPDGQVQVVEIDPALRDLVAATILRQLAQMMLAPGAADQLGVKSGLAARTLRGNPVTRDLADDGLSLAQWAVRLRPNAEGAQLTLAQTMLGVLVSMTGRASTDVDHEVSRRAREVEATALRVRDVLREWDGDSGSALAVAARARSMQGDVTGALRLLLPAPDGVASQREARNQEVIRLGAFIARITGNDELALELAAKNTDRAEGELIRAAVLSDRPQMAGEAKDALLAALEKSEGRHHSDFQALMALVRRFNSLSEGEQAIVIEHIESLEQADPDLADIMRARASLAQGDPEKALQYIRGLDRNELALEAHADALVASGRAEEAAQLVFREGMTRGDIPLATEALQIAMTNGLTEIARDLALRLLARDDGKPVRMKALRALQHIARSEHSWQEVATRTNQIIKEWAANDLPVPEIEHWQLAEALYFLDRFDNALDVLLNAPSVTFNERERALLFLSILRHVVDEQRARGDSQIAPTVAGLGGKKLFSMFMRAAAEWAGDEQIAAVAISTVLMAPGSSFTDAQIAAFRTYADKYFETHGQDASIKQIQVEEGNLDALLKFLASDHSRQQALEELAREVRAGRFPLAVLTEAAGRTCTESLIRRDLGYVMAVDEDGGIGVQAARAALGQRVIVDTTAMVVAPWTGHPLRKLVARFDSVLVPAPLREDIARARSSLAMRSTASLGWDSQHQRPVFTETTPEQAQIYADAAEQVWADVQGLQVVPVADATRRDRWLSAITVAQELGLPVWADDSVLRQFARSTGVPAFGSLDVVRAIEDEAGVVAAIASLRDNRVVDITIDLPWHSLANQVQWSVDSPFAIAITRAAAWRDLPQAFAQFRSLIHGRPSDMPPEKIATWTYLAAAGLAMATPPSARPRVVAALLAWVIFFADPFFTEMRAVTLADNMPEDAGRLTQLILTAADDLRDRYFPDGETLGPLVDVLCQGLLETIGPEATSQAVAALVTRLEGDAGRRFFATYIQSAGR